MASRKSFHLLLLLLLLRSVAAVVKVSNEDIDSFQLRDYIVHVEPEFDDQMNVDSNYIYESLLAAALNSKSLAVGPGGGAPPSASARELGTYSDPITGFVTWFVAKLSKKEVEVLSMMSWFVLAYPDVVFKLAPHGVLIPPPGSSFPEAASATISSSSE